MSERSLNEPELSALLQAAREVARNSYSPYSRFRVGAALKLSNGEIATGTNVENASYGLTICAERSAVVRAVAQFGPETRIEAVAVANLNDAASPPCGACRQVLAEFIAPDAPVIFAVSGGTTTVPFSELLPWTFEMSRPLAVPPNPKLTQSTRGARPLPLHAEDSKA